MIDTNSEFKPLQPETAPPEPFPWPPHPDASALEAFFTTWRRCVFHPTSFFRRMPRSEGYGFVLAYYLVLGVIAAGIDLFWQSVLGWSLSERLMNEDRSRLEDVVQFLLSPLILIVGLYVVTGVCHLLLLMMRGAKHGFETSSRVFAFSYSPALFNVIPILGGLVAFIWMTVIAVVGLREAQETSGGKAAAAVLIPLFMLLSLLFVVLVAAMVMGILSTRI